MKRKNPLTEPITPFIDRLRAGRLVKFALLALGIILFFAAAYYSILLAVLVSALITYLLGPLVDALEKRRVPRAVAVASIELLTLGGIAFAIMRLIPLVYEQSLALIQLVPKALEVILDSWVPMTERFVAGFGFLSAEEVHKYIQSISVLNRLESQLQAGISGLWRTGVSLAGGAINLVLIPVLTLFFLKDYQVLRTGLSRLVPPDLREPLHTVLHKVDQTLRTVLKGQVIVAMILGILYVIGLSLVGIPSAIAIGVVAGICRLIPYLDVIVGGTLSAIVLLSDFQGWTPVLMVVVVFVTVQGIDGAFITPAVLGDRIGLHPVVVVATVLAFADWFGFWGVIMAVPVAAVIKVLIAFGKPFYLSSRFYQPPH